MVDKLYTPQEAAEMLRVTRKTIYNWIEAGSIHAIKLPGSGVRISQSEIMRILSAVIKAA
jgi:excisionase family DNA binding protein